MLLNQEEFIQAELDYRVGRMVADRDAAQQRRAARAAARGERRTGRHHRLPRHRTAAAH